MLITGATSGIGYALCKLAAGRNYNVIACGRNQAKLDELAKLDNISTLAFDVSDEQQSKTVLAGAKADIYVLNAGVCEYVDVETIEPAMFQRVFAANFFGVVNCIAGIRQSLHSGNQLVLVDSLARLLPFTRSQAYGASKAALHYLCKSLQVDLKSAGITVQSVSPGFVSTPLTDKNDFEMPMKISAEQAAISLLKGIEKRRASIYLPKLFSVFLLLLSRLPMTTQVAISSRIKG